MLTASKWQSQNRNPVICPLSIVLIPTCGKHYMAQSQGEKNNNKANVLIATISSPFQRFFVCLFFS